MKKFIIASLTFVPYVASAVVLSDSINTVNTLIASLIPLLITLATVVFLWGIVRYVTAGGDEEKLKEGRNLMIFGIIALAVMISVWGIAKLLAGTFGVNGVGVPNNIGTL
ncbi:MAG: hypothetical protein AAB783_00945 [Patescibacteria group bacterium]